MVLYDLESIAAVVVGGTALSGAAKAAWRVRLPVSSFFAILDTMFNQIGMDAFLKQFCAAPSSFWPWRVTYRYKGRSRIGESL